MPRQRARGSSSQAPLLSDCPPHMNSSTAPPISTTQAVIIHLWSAAVGEDGSFCDSASPEGAWWILVVS